MENQEKSKSQAETTPSGTGTEKEIGFGTKVYGPSIRMINPDGSPNVVKTGRGWFRHYEVYQRLITMPWWRLGVLIVLGYFLTNILFSAAYLAVGMDSLAGVTGESTWEQCLDAFFFSAQTITTLGYGRISPVGTAASSIAAIESMLGLLGFALATGLVYGRFSRPNARIKFSENALVAPYRGITGLMFRMANERSSDLIEAEVEVTLSYVDLERNKRTFKLLELEISRINLFAMSWTVVHPIDEESPFYGLGLAELERRDIELVILLKAFEASFSSTVYRRQSYKASEILFGKKFAPMSEPIEGSIHVDLGKISAVIDAK